MYNQFKAVVSKVSSAISVVSMVINFVIMFVLVVDIILRLTTEKMAVLGTYELTELSMVLIVFLSFAVTQIDKENVHVTLFTDRFPYRAKAYVDGVISGLTSILCAVIFYASVLQGIGDTKSGITTAVLYIPTFPFVWIMAIGFLLLTIVLLVDTIDYFIKAIENNPPVNKMENAE